MPMTELFHLPNRLKNEYEWLKEAKYFEKLDSTQNRINQFLPKNPEGPVLILAESQSKGVGRQGRKWVSPPGGIWFTFGLPMKDKDVGKVAPFSIVSALACINALREVNSLDATLKWPNDIQVNGKKLGGVILSTTTKFKKPWMLIGIGINVNNDIPGVKDAISIKEIRSQTQGRSRLIEAILSNIWEAWAEFDKTGFGPYKKAVEDRMVGKGESARVLVGDKTMKGTVIGIDTQGGLLLKSLSETMTVHAGEIVN